MKFRSTLLLIALMIGLSVSAQSLDVGTEKDPRLRLPFELSFSFVINDDSSDLGYSADFGFAYFPIQYVGAALKIGFLYGEDDVDTTDYFPDWSTSIDIDTDDARFRLVPTLQFRTPKLLRIKSSEFFGFCDTGIVISPKPKRLKRAQTAGFELKAGLNMQHNRWIYTVGYYYSTFSARWGNPGYTHKMVQGLNLGIAFKF